MPRMDGAAYVHRERYVTGESGDILSAKARKENERLERIRAKMRENNLELSARDLLGTNYGNAYDSQNRVAPPVLSEGDMLAGLTADEAAELRDSMRANADDNYGYTPSYSPTMRGLNEDRVPQHSGSILNERGQGMRYTEQQMQQPRPRSEPTWSSTKMNAKLKSGTVVPVWKVTDSRTGMELPTPFRIESVADRIAAILNETGNVNHPSIVSTVGAYNKRIAIMKEMRQVKQMISEGQPAKKGRLQQLQSDLAGVDIKLGIIE